MPFSPKIMPIQIGGALKRRFDSGERVVVVTSIPWDMICLDAMEWQCRENHSGQSLDDIARRLGFDACEAICVMACMPWTQLGSEEQCHRILYAMRTLFNRGQLLQREAHQPT